jgi:gas vesicle protein
MNNTSKVLVAFAVGAVAGTVISLLYAPKSGAATRKGIVDQTKKFTDAVQNRFRDASEKFKDMKTGMRDKMDEIKDKVMA